MTQWHDDDRVALTPKGEAMATRVVDEAHPLEPGQAEATIDEWLTESSSDLQKIIRGAGLSVGSFRRAVEDLRARGWLSIRRSDADRGFYFYTTVPKDGAKELTHAQKQIIAATSRLFPSTVSRGRLDSQTFSPIEVYEPGHMRAVNMQYGALATLADLIERTERKLKAIRVIGGPEPRHGGWKLSEHLTNWQTEFRIMKRAATYCWYDEPTQAVQLTAATLPDTVRLDRDLTSTYAGWWYFTDKLAIQTTTDEPFIVGISWSWVEVKEVESVGGPLAGFTSAGVLMSAYVITDDQWPVPSTEFFWEEGQTLRECVTMTEATLRKNFASQADVIERLAMTMTAVEQMVRFFAAGSLWLKQKIPVLVQSTQPIERHARKRMEAGREATLRPMSDVQVIQLRRREYKPVEPLESTDGSKPVKWRSRWIVGADMNNWRNQFYKSKGYSVPILILPYVKGPADKPLRVPKQRIYAVKR